MRPAAGVFISMSVLTSPRKPPESMLAASSASKGLGATRCLATRHRSSPERPTFGILFPRDADAPASCTSISRSRSVRRECTAASLALAAACTSRTSAEATTAGWTSSSSALSASHSACSCAIDAAASASSALPLGSRHSMSFTLRWLSSVPSSSFIAGVWLWCIHELSLVVGSAGAAVPAFPSAYCLRPAARRLIDGHFPLARLALYDTSSTASCSTPSCPAASSFASPKPSPRIPSKKLSIMKNIRTTRMRRNSHSESSWAIVRAWSGRNLPSPNAAGSTSEATAMYRKALAGVSMSAEREPKMTAAVIAQPHMAMPSTRRK
mmetsp:Transcript_12371/g.42878  ORF Transcript_12371/g.42878 Transcript_12371/m.42878 type:complete len:324 (+) Transcript_12371:1112-2083(+)